MFARVSSQRKYQWETNVSVLSLFVLPRGENDTKAVGGYSPRYIGPSGEALNSHATPRTFMHVSFAHEAKGSKTLHLLQKRNPPVPGSPGCTN